VEQNDLLRHTIDALERLGVRYMLVGSFASIAYGEPRLTQDIDVVVDLPEQLIAQFCSTFPAPEFYLSEAAVRDSLRSRTPFNVLHPSSGNKIDFMPPRDDEWGRVQLNRRQRVRLLADREGYAARPEDVIIGKLWYYSEGGSEKHLRDIAGMLQISSDQIDRDEIARWADKLGFTPIWQAVLGRLSST
jgi:predicted nucleotidyltransferase